MENNFWVEKLNEIVDYCSLEEYVSLFTENNVLGTYDITFLAIASLHGRLDIVKELTRLGASPISLRPKTIAWVNFKGHKEIVDFLVENGATNDWIEEYNYIVAEAEERISYINMRELSNIGLQGFFEGNIPDSFLSD